MVRALWSRHGWGNLTGHRVHLYQHGNNYCRRRPDYLLVWGDLVPSIPTEAGHIARVALNRDELNPESGCVWLRDLTASEEAFRCKVEFFGGRLWL